MGPSSQGETFFFAKYWWPVGWVPAVRWRSNYFLCNKEALPCGCRGPSCQSLHVQYSSDGSRSLTTLTTPRREHHGGGRRRGLGRGRRGAGPREAGACGSTAGHGGRSKRHDRRCFGRLEQEDQRLKKHYGRWMDIVRSLELESFILTKLTKPFVPVNLVGPQVSLPPRWVPASRGYSFFCA